MYSDHRVAAGTALSLRPSWSSTAIVTAASGKRRMTASLSLSGMSLQPNHRPPFRSRPLALRQCHIA